MSENGDSNITANEQRIHVSVCICTYRRLDGIERLLDALTKQRFQDLPKPHITIIVIDNEGSQAVKDLCDRYRDSSFDAIHYAFEPAPGISYARNAGIDNVPDDTGFVAMIDDDEVPEPSWLNHLLLAQYETAADVVVGPTLPIFHENTESWIIRTGYFNKPQHPESFSNLQENPPAATCNVLVRASIFTSLNFRFDEKLALSGGEDKLLFQDLKLNGFQFTWAENAIVHEHIPVERSTLRYMLREEYRRGTVKHYVKVQLKAKNVLKQFILVPRSTFRALAKVTSSTASLLAKSITAKGDKTTLALAAISIADGIGTLAGILGLRKRHYR
jgi:glycosyltransferase involved in cell wall biosynthesis